MNRTEQAVHVLESLHRQYPAADCTLDYGKPWQLMVAAIIAAQCTDARVNLITAELFRHYPDLPSLAAAPVEDIERDIRSCGLFRNKARSISGASRMLVAEHGGQVPASLDALIALPGVGRKIANLILGDCFGIPAVVVDTHCLRISRLIGLTDHTDPLKVERDLTAVLPESEWIAYGHLVVTHGREICIARRPQCGRCPVLPWCRFGSGRAAEPGARSEAEEAATVAETVDDAAEIDAILARPAGQGAPAEPPVAARPARRVRKQPHG